MTSADQNSEQSPEEQGQQPETSEEAAEEGQASQPANADERVLAAEAQVAEMKDRMMRALAEAENTRKRALKDREDAIKFAAAGFAKDLLDFSDNFRRALDAIPEDIEDARVKNVLEGLGAMERELLQVFDRHKIQKIEPLDEVFNPNFHEVMFEAPMPGKAAGTIIEVIEPGYILHDRLLRAAKVGISKGDPAGGDDSPEPGAQIDTEA